MAISGIFGNQCFIHASPMPCEFCAKERRDKEKKEILRKYPELEQIESLPSLSKNLKVRIRSQGRQ